MTDPDRQGFEKTLALPLKVVSGGVFAGMRGTTEERIREVMHRCGIIEAQKYLNHFHMGQRTRVLDVQRQWAFELLDHFRAKATAVCPDRTLLGEVRDDGRDVEVTFWLPSHE